MKKVLSKQGLQELIELAEASGNEKLSRGVRLVVHEVKVLRFKQTQRPNKKTAPVAADTVKDRY